MKQKIGPIAVVIGVVVLIGFMYMMYKKTDDSTTNNYDPKNGPPAYINQGKGGGSGAGYYKGGETPGKK